MSNPGIGAERFYIGDPDMKQILYCVAPFSRKLIGLSLTSGGIGKSVRYGAGKVQSARANKMRFSPLLGQTGYSLTCYNNV